MVKPYELATHAARSLDALTSTDVPLGASLRALLQEAHLRDTFRTLFHRELLSCDVGWPRTIRAASELVPSDVPHAESWLRRSDILIELAHAPAHEPFALGLALHAESGARLVDWLLGGPGNSGVASAAGQPSEAECGVLAYAAARLCATQPSPWIVRDVRRQDLGTSLATGALILWPLSLRCSTGSLAGTLLLTPAVAATSAHHMLEVIVHDRVEPDALRELSTGDVLVSDSWTLTETTAGLTGSVVLGVAGTDTRLAARLACGQLEAQSAAAAPVEDQLELVLARLLLPFTELAELASGAPLPVTQLGREPAFLRWRGSLLARGELVRHHGALGIRVTHVPPTHAAP